MQQLSASVLSRSEVEKGALWCLTMMHGSHTVAFAALKSLTATLMPCTMPSRTGVSRLL